VKALILAAGLGTRLRPLTDSVPKVLVPVLGVPILDRILAFLESSGLTEVAVNTHHLAAAVESHAAALRRRFRVRIETFHEPQILGTGGAIPHLGAFWADEPLLVWNGDVLADVDLAALVSSHAASGAAATLILHDRPAERSCLLVDDGDRVVGIDSAARGGRRVLESPQGHPRPLAFTGISLLSPHLRPWLRRPAPFDLIDAVLDAIAAGESVRCSDLGSALWGTTGTREEWADLESALSARPDSLSRFTPGPVQG
jgi:NDP-sugar pyrophosphorylase family protein